MKTTLQQIIIFTLFFFVRQLSVSADPSWHKKQITSDASFNKVFFVNQEIGWLVGFNGAIYKTTNCGDTWQKQQTEITNSLNSLYFIDTKIGWVAGDSGSVFSTSNGGDTWIRSVIGTTNDIADVYFRDENTGWISSTNGLILHTTDGGVLWQKQISGTIFDLGSIVFVHNTGWVLAGSSFLKTTNGGLGWITHELESKSFISSIFFTTELEGWYITLIGEIYHSTDGGNQWLKQESGISQIQGQSKRLFSIHFVNNNIGWAVGEEGIILHTTDGGNTWIKQSSETNVSLFSVFGINENVCFATGMSGMMLKYGLSTSVEEKYLLSDIEEFGVVPNPSKGEIRLIGNFSSFKPIELFSISGLKVAEYFSSEQIRTSNLPIGVYVVRVGDKSSVFVNN